ncbi:hypothetical protein BCV71DRAFT_219612 [Rhizopus microsporus]|uniref:Uncharacterized protein n=1 Tax=Rhizopus microsporus TaxID=58291 RepID=A0A1X0RTM6_RHIZD|nr:hypothetical protein BCV71DRAFT_219612 [Rhizopus microsporus]
MRFITNTENVCLVALDYAGLSTSSNDLYGFLKQHPNLKIIIITIIIDSIADKSNVLTYKRSRLLNEPDTLKKFECRSKLVQRSK